MLLLRSATKLLIAATLFVSALASTSVHAEETSSSPDGRFQAYLPLMVAAQQPIVSPQASVEAEVLQLTNDLRVAHGCAPLVLSPELTAAASAHSQDMARMGNSISHTGSDGSSFVDRIERAGYTDFSIVAENIAAGYATPKDVVEGWYNSPGHRANLLNCELKEIGIGFVYTDATDWHYYWTQDFGTR